MIKILTLLAIIVISMQTDIERVVAEKNTRTVKSKKIKNTFKRAKAVSPCNSAVFDVTIMIDGNEATKVAASFDAREIKTPTGESVRGWRFTIPTINDDAKKVLYLGETSYYFLPYRLLSLSFSSDIPAGVGKIITTTYQSSATEIHSVIIQFAYDAVWEVIEDSVLGKIVSFLNTNRSDRMMFIKQIKEKANEQAEIYKQNMTNANLAGASSTAIQAQITKLTADIATLDASTTKAQTDLDANEKLIVTQKAKIDGLKTTQKGYDSTLQSLAGTKTSQEGSLTKYKADQTSNTGSQTQYQTAYQGALQKIDGLITTFKPECADMGTYMDTARTKLISEKATTNFISNINKALSTTATR
jgi:hypothetical protein